MVSTYKKPGCLFSYLPVSCMFSQLFVCVQHLQLSEMSRLRLRCGFSDPLCSPPSRCCSLHVPAPKKEHQLVSILTSVFTAVSNKHLLSIACSAFLKVRLETKHRPFLLNCVCFGYYTRDRAAPLWPKSLFAFTSMLCNYNYSLFAFASMLCNYNYLHSNQTFTFTLLQEHY